MTRPLSPGQVAIAALAAGLALVAVPAAAAAPAQTYTVTIRQMSFGAVPPTLHVGDRITWVNDDIFLHSATAADKSFDVDLKPQAHATITLKRPGTIPFSCRYHPGMKGRLVVTK